MSSSDLRLKQADDPNLVKLQALVNREDKLFLQSVHPEKGWIVKAFAQFISALVSDCKTNDITCYTHENAARLEEFIRLRTSPSVTQYGSARTPTRGPASLHWAGESLTDQSADPSQEAPGGLPGRGNRKPRKVHKDPKEQG